MRPIDWMLGHLDEPGVSEIVLGVGRPAAVRTADGFRPITSMNFDRTEIETLVAGTPLSGLIGSPTSLPPTEIQIDERRVIVEVVRQGFNAALRIALVGAQPQDDASEPPAPRPSSSTLSPRTMTPIAPPRTMTPTAPPQTVAEEPTVPPDDAPVVAVRMTSSTRTSTTTFAPRTMTPTMPRTMTPASTPPPTVAPRTMTPSSTPPFEARTPTPSSPPEARTPTPSSTPPPARTSTSERPRTPTPGSAPTVRRSSPSSPPPSIRGSGSPTSPPPNIRGTGSTTPPPLVSRPVTVTRSPLTVTPASTTTIPKIESNVETPTVDENGFLLPQVKTEGIDHALALSLGGGGEIVDEETALEFERADYANGPAPVGGAPELPAPDWYGPQIVDEFTDIGPVQALLEAAYRRAASDLHIIANQRVTIRHLGELAPLDAKSLVAPVDRTVINALFGPLESTAAERFLLPLLGPSAQKRLAEVGYVDLGFQVPGRGRVRANISQQQDGLAGTFRLCRDTIPSLDGLGLPRDLEKTVRHHQGLVIIAGPSGAGKTTTMAALVDLLNTSNSDHIITIEDPVEIEHPPKKAIVSHREVGRHTLSFVSALKASLREDPDVIVIGELRDRETVEIALAAAETGHLVLSTISTPSAVKTIDRLIDMFPPDDQVQVRASISGTLRAVIAQRLLPNIARDGQVAAIELVTGVLPLATMIRDNKMYQLPSLMQRGRAFGMIRLDDSLADCVRNRRISEEVALAAADNRKELAAVLAGRPAPSPTSSRGLFGGKGPA